MKFNHKADDLTKAIGISDKRNNELKSMVIKSKVLEGDKVSQTLEFIHKAKMTPIEKIFVAHNIGRMAGMRQMPSLPAGFGEALKDIEGMIKLAEAKAVKQSKKAPAKKGKK